jgi:hypothetical protein
MWPGRAVAAGPSHGVAITDADRLTLAHRLALADRFSVGVQFANGGCHGHVKALVPSLVTLRLEWSCRHLDERVRMAA